MCMHMWKSAHNSQESILYFHHVGVPGIKLGSSGLTVSDFILRTISLALSSFSLQRVWGVRVLASLPEKTCASKETKPPHLTKPLSYA